ncbi:choice-of-anchor M domain-containing protein [Tautonia marina]|uniref:choice-of-anchor M domain-containing protein n=1 Tax=Tautonia marina TaxID=2653855 RepID=UPI001375D9CE|nr:choice-of-anchor M domain-containing protein [Tautonia marina]
MSFHRFFSRVVGGGLLAFAFSMGLGDVAIADTIISGGHWDVDVEYDGANEEFELHWHLHGTDTVIETDEALLYLDPSNTALTRPGGAQWDFLGTGAGDLVYILPFDEPADLSSLVWLGLSAEEIPTGTFNPNNITLSLVGFSGPGEFSLFTTDSFGNPNVFMATSDGLSSGDAINLTLGSHRHANWAFSELGLYGLTFEASGTLLDGRVIRSTPTTFYFGVGVNSFPGQPGVIPEPASLVMLGMGVLAVGGAALLRRRREGFESKTV